MKSDKERLREYTQNFLGGAQVEWYIQLGMLLNEPLQLKPAFDPPWPAEVDLILSAMEAAEGKYADRREHERLPFRTRAALRLFSDTEGLEPWLLYTRDVNAGWASSRRIVCRWGMADGSNCFHRADERSVLTARCSGVAKRSKGGTTAHSISIASNTSSIRSGDPFTCGVVA